MYTNIPKNKETLNKKIHVSITKTDEEIYDLTINMQNFEKEYFMVIEHILNQYNSETEKGDYLALQQQFHKDNTPIFDLQDHLLIEIKNKINDQGFLNMRWRKNS